MTEGTCLQFFLRQFHTCNLVQCTNQWMFLHGAITNIHKCDPSGRKKMRKILNFLPLSWIIWDCSCILSPWFLQVQAHFSAIVPLPCPSMYGLCDYGEDCEVYNILLPFNGTRPSSGWCVRQWRKKVPSNYRSTISLGYESHICCMEYYTQTDSCKNETVIHL